MNAEANLTIGVGTSGLFGQGDAHVSCGGARSARVLVVDDDPLAKRMLVNYLEQHDMRVTSASQRQDVVREFAVGEPSLIILDVRLRQEDGLDLLREIRSHSDVPVIITNGQRCEETDRVVGLELGADDYVTKPFGPRELLARIRAVLRRQDAVAPPRSARPDRAAAGLAAGNSIAGRAA